MRWRKRLACSFCGRSAADVTKLVAGPHVYICDGCVAIAQRIMADAVDHQPPAPSARPNLWHRVVSRIRRIDDRGTRGRWHCGLLRHTPR